jgi:hypothetical protein
VRSVSATITDSGSQTANCLAGETATGGGYTFASGDVNSIRVLTSFPTADGTGKPVGWNVGWSASGPHFVVVYVICAS